MIIIGYKCFNKDLINQYGFQYEIGKTYTVSGELKFGNNGNGFHFCRNLEDTLRYYDALKNNVDICLVIGSGNIITFEDNYYGYYDMYASENISIVKKLTRNEIIMYGYNLSEPRVNRFIAGYQLTEEEKEMFKSKFNRRSEVINTIEYYQEGNLDAFTKKYIKK